MKGRVSYVDEISGLMIIVMVLIHVASRCEYADGILVRTFYFFMSWFYFKAGYFWKDSETREVICKGKKRLLKPYVWFSVIAMVVTMCLQPDLNNLLVNFKVLLVSGAIIANIPLWFLISLFTVKVLSNLLLCHKSFNAGETVMLIMLIILPVVTGFAIHDIGFKKPEWIAYNILGVGFYMGGYFTTNMSNPQKDF